MPDLAIGDLVVKDPATWRPSEFDAWGSGEGVGLVVEPPFPLDPDTLDVVWPAGRAFATRAELLPGPVGSELEGRALVARLGMVDLAGDP